MAELTESRYLYDLERGHEVVLRFARGTYADNRSLAIMAYIEIEHGVWEFYDVVTVNLGDTPDENVQFIHVNHWKNDFISWMVKNRMGHPTGRYQKSGFVTYPEFQFSQSFLDSMDYDPNLSPTWVDPNPEPREEYPWDEMGDFTGDESYFEVANNLSDETSDNIAYAMEEPATEYSRFPFCDPKDLRYDPDFDEFVHLWEDPTRIPLATKDEGIPF